MLENIKNAYSVGLCTLVASLIVVTITAPSLFGYLIVSSAVIGGCVLWMLVGTIIGFFYRPIMNKLKREKENV